MRVKSVHGEGIGKMGFVSIKDAMRQGEGKVSIRGWIWRVRGSSKRAFIVLRDSSDVVQCVFESERFGDCWSVLDKLQIEASMHIHGVIRKDERAPSGYEILADDFGACGAVGSVSDSEGSEF
ncbi:MAG: hypothetical protein HC945_02055 [Nitrosarchaeum sp.]|nr:hypothetical protein [Nitrosarchaeum sp.]